MPAMHSANRRSWLILAGFVAAGTAELVPGLGEARPPRTIRGGPVTLQGHRRRALAAGIATAVAALTLSGGAARAASTSPHWRVVSSPNTSSSQRNYLEGVSCVNSSFCMAAGDYYNGTNYQTLIEKWNGSTWSLVSSPNTSSTQGNYLNGVSCRSSSFCMAAGYYYAGTYDQTLTEKW